MPAKIHIFVMCSWRSGMVTIRQTRGSRFESHQRPKIFREFQTSTDGLGLRKILIRPKNDDWDLEKFGWDQKS